MTGRMSVAAWKHAGFRQLVRAWFFTNVADSALFLMLAVWVKELTGSDGAAAMIFVLMGLPALLAPFLGQLADRMSRRKLMIVANIVMVPVLLTLLAVDSASQVWLIYAVVFVYGAIGFLTPAAGSGLLRDLLADDELASGNGLLATMDQGLRLVSPLLGTGLYVLWGAPGVILLTAACFVLTVLLLTRLRVDESPPARPAAGAGYWTEVIAGFTHLFGRPLLRMLTVVLGVAFGVAGLVNAAVFPVMEQGLGVDPALLGVFVSLQGIGALVGGITSSMMIGRLGEKGAVAAGCLLLGLGMLPLIGSSTLLVGAGMAVIGLGVPWLLVAYTTLRQRLTPPRLQGRTAAASNVVLSLPQTVATMAAAAVIGVIDYRILIIAAAIVIVLCALAAARSRAQATGPA